MSAEEQRLGGKKSMKASGNAVKEPAPSIEEGDELFQVTADGVNFRTVGWLRASVIFLKSTGTVQLEIYRAYHLT